MGKARMEMTEEGLKIRARFHSDKKDNGVR